MGSFDVNCTLSHGMHWCASEKLKRDAERCRLDANRDGLRTLETIIINDLICYKYLNNKCEIGNLDSLCVSGITQTRGHPMKLTRSFCRTMVDC